jgi:endonuclease YncB( thermonuclease family)
MPRRVFTLLVLFALILLPALAGGHARAQREPEWEIPEDAERVELYDVIDGDTFDVDLFQANGRVREERIRMIGIDTPETSYSYGNEPECYGREATKKTESLLVAADEIWVSGDVENVDPADRLLRYVWYLSPVDDEVHFLNRELVAEGYALAKTYRPNTAYQDELDDAEEVAITEGRGMWLACDGSVSLDPTLEADGEPDADRIDRTLTPVTEDEDAVCSFFDTFDQAQDFMDAYPEVAEIIDPDGDGLACEAYFGVDR